MATPTELQWQREIIKNLVEQHGYHEIKDESGEYDVQRAIIPTEFVEFLKGTKSGRELLKKYKGEAIVDSLVYALDHLPGVGSEEHHSMLDVWRHGFEHKGEVIKPVKYRPEDAIDPQELDDYNANRLSVIQELHYDPQDGAKNNRLDWALFLNGIPVATIELKNQFTGQTSANAVQQYKCDRSPNAPIFKFPHRGIVHFAVDRDDVQMTTQVKGGGSQFLPFNRGVDGGKGNPPIPDRKESATAYLYRDLKVDAYDGDGRLETTRNAAAVWSRDRMIDTVTSYAFFEKPDIDKPDDTGTMIFPRYHQYDAVEAVLDHTRKYGAGKSYLVAHSTGSGKSYTMAWLAHQLSDLHRNERTEKVFGTVLVVTDRLQLDKQLRDLVSSVSHYAGSVSSAEKGSKDLAKLLTASGVDSADTPIITTTLQKFQNLADTGVKGQIKSNVAIIIDEAHSSQGNILQQKMEDVLNRLGQGNEAVISYYAFTATPRTRTREVFGVPYEAEKKYPFHIYGMRQAREEGFIIDVLRNLVSRKVNATVETDAPDEEVTSGDVRLAAAEDARVVRKKAEYILYHFDSRKIAQSFKRKECPEGEGKAMVLAPSIRAGVRYFRILKELIAKEELNYGVLIAFTGEPPDPDAPKIVGVNKVADRVSEAKLNGGISGNDIATSLRKTHHILVAVDKFQTGFNEPRLMAMYIDKPLKGINAIQTLSRLNRQHKGLKGKGQATFPHVVDFVNPVEDHVAEFMSQEGAAMNGYDYITKDYIEELYSHLNHYMDEDSIEEFRKIDAAFAKSRKKDNTGLSGPVADFFLRIKDVLKGLSDDDQYSYIKALEQYICQWPYARLVLKKDFRAKDPATQRYNTYHQMAVFLYKFVQDLGGKKHQKKNRLDPDLIHVVGEIHLERRSTEIADKNWEEFTGNPIEEPEETESKPKEFRVANRRVKHPKRVQQLIDAYHAKLGISYDDTEAREEADSNILDMQERLAQRQYEDPAVEKTRSSGGGLASHQHVYRIRWKENADEMWDAGNEAERSAIETILAAGDPLANEFAAIDYDLRDSA